MKFVCSFLIVYIHTYNHDWGVIGEWFYTNLSPVGVPFFFIVSGFLYAKGLKNASEQKHYFKRYFKRMVYMYLFWTVITFPVDWMNVCIAHGDYNFVWKVIYQVRCFFFTGSLGIYWYLLALIYNSIIIYYAQKWDKLFLLYVISFFFFVIGVLYNGGLIRQTIIGDIIYVVIGSERNFLNVGLFYMCMGVFLFKKRFVMRKRFTIFLLVLSVVLSTILNSISSYRIMQAPIAFLLFMFAIQFEFVKSKRSSMRLRKWSTVIYLGHFPFILIFDYYLMRGSIIDVPISILFSFVLYYSISKVFPDGLVKIAYG